MRATASWLAQSAQRAAINVPRIYTYGTITYHQYLDSFYRYVSRCVMPKLAGATGFSHHAYALVDPARAAGRVGAEGGPCDKDAADDRQRQNCAHALRGTVRTY